jgi:hypothetical protein
MKQDDLRLKMERAILDHRIVRWMASMGILAGLWAILARRRHV